MEVVKELKNDLVEALGDNLVSLVLYGSAAVDDRTRHYSDINVLVVVRDPGLATLKMIAPAARRWQRRKNPPPRVLALSFIEKGLDVFPIEFLDIRSSHIVLHGSDPFADIDPDPEALRRQLEFEFRARLLTLQQRYFEAGGNQKILEEIMARSLSSFTVLARTMLHLTGRNVPTKRTDVWKAMAELIGADIAAVVDILLIRDGTPPRQSGEVLFGGYLALLMRIVDFIDGFEITKII